jgi:DNA replication protein DnaC
MGEVLMFKLDDIKAVRRMWLKVAGIPKARLGWTLADCKDVSSERMSDIKRWLGYVQDNDIILATGNKRCGKGLLLWGEPGHGKTTLALSIIQEIITTFPIESFKVEPGHSLIRPCYFATFNDIIDLKGSLIGGSAKEDKDILYQGMLGECEDDAYNIRILIVDDLGKEHSSLSGWQSSLFHHLLRTRFNNGLPTIVTTNIKLENWASEYGDATESFANEAFYYMPIAMTEDLRK